MSEKRTYPKYNTLKSVIGDYYQPPFVTQEIFDSAISYKPEKSDLFVATYPKNGTTWMVRNCFYTKVKKFVTKTSLSNDVFFVFCMHF